MSKLTIVHLIAAKRILIYLEGTLDYDIVLQKRLTALSSFFILTGMEIHMIDVLQVVSASSLRRIQFLGHPRNNLLLLED